MNLPYLLPRLARHFLPEEAARFLLRRRWLIRPGLETSDPISAVQQYRQALQQAGCSLEGKRCLVFGYGGRFAVAVELLRQGAAHVVLCDHIASMDNERNLLLLPEYGEYLTSEDGLVRPEPEHITLLHGDIRDEKVGQSIGLVDIVLSTSVYEHLADVEGVTSALAALTKPDGLHIHYVDLRDHFFKYPFEMLCYSEKVWLGLLNPTSHHNRYRLKDFRRVFDERFARVEITVIERDQRAFLRARPRIRPEFLSGEAEQDSVTLICVAASQPIAHTAARPGS